MYSVTAVKCFSLLHHLCIQSYLGFSITWTDAEARSIPFVRVPNSHLGSYATVCKLWVLMNALQNDKVDSKLVDFQDNRKATSSTSSALFHLECAVPCLFLLFTLSQLISQMSARVDAVDENIQ